MIRDQIDSIAAVADSVAKDLSVQNFGPSYLTTGFFTQVLQNLTCSRIKGDKF